MPVHVELGAKRTVLPNGLEVLAMEDHRFPTVSVRVRYHAGSKDDPPNAQGLAHLVEHLAFMQTAHIARDEIWSLFRKCNAFNVNGETGFDSTDYHETVPRRHLERALFIERERMAFALEGVDDANFEREKAVVLNEWRQNYETRPYGIAYSTALSAAFPEGHPYHSWTIGNAEQLKAAPLAVARDFYKANYAPNNATLVLVGDFKAGDATALAEKYFGDLAPAAIKAPRALKFDQAMRGRVIKMEANVPKSRLLLVYRFPVKGTPEWYESVHALSRLRSTLLRMRSYFTNREQGAVRTILDGGELGRVGGLEMTGTKDQDPSVLRDEFERAVTQYASFESRSSDVNLRSGFIIDALYDLEQTGSRAEKLLTLEAEFKDPNAAQRELKGWMGVQFTDARDHAGDRFDLDHAIQVEVRPNPKAPLAGVVVGESK